MKENKNYRLQEWTRKLLSHSSVHNYTRVGITCNSLVIRFLLLYEHLNFPDWRARVFIIFHIVGKVDYEKSYDMKIWTPCFRKLEKHARNSSKLAQTLSPFRKTEWKSALFFSKITIPPDTSFETNTLRRWKTIETQMQSRSQRLERCNG